MHATGVDSERLPDRATPYFPRYAADPRYGPDPMREVDYSCYAGSSVFVTTPSDLVRFGMAVNGGTFLQPATVQLLQTAQRLPSGQPTGYGLGWDLETIDLAGAPASAAGHDGELLGGPAAALLTFRDRGLVVAVSPTVVRRSGSDRPPGRAGVRRKTAQLERHDKASPGVHGSC